MEECGRPGAGARQPRARAARAAQQPPPSRPRAGRTFHALAVAAQYAHGHGQRECVSVCGVFGVGRRAERAGPKAGADGLASSAVGVWCGWSVGSQSSSLTDRAACGEGESESHGGVWLEARKKGKRKRCACACSPAPRRGGDPQRHLNPLHPPNTPLFHLFRLPMRLTLKPTRPALPKERHQRGCGRLNRKNTTIFDDVGKL